MKREKQIETEILERLKMERQENSVEQRKGVKGAKNTTRIYALCIDCRLEKYEIILKIKRAKRNEKQCANLRDGKGRPYKQPLTLKRERKWRER